jgi:hypothetical protein
VLKLGVKKDSYMHSNTILKESEPVDFLRNYTTLEGVAVRRSYVVPVSCCCTVSQSLTTKFITPVLD